MRVVRTARDITGCDDHRIATHRIGRTSIAARHPAGDDKSHRHQRYDAYAPLTPTRPCSPHSEPPADARSAITVAPNDGGRNLGSWLAGHWHPVSPSQKP